MMIHALLLILGCQLLGEITSRSTAIPVPGPVVGMAIMLGLLVASPRLQTMIATTGRTILAHMSLLFVPAGVGVVGHLATLKDEALAIGLALTISTLLAIAVGALTFAAVARFTGGPSAEEEKHG